VLKSLLESHTEVPWDALRFVTGFINYGGRVTDEHDRRCLISILTNLCSQELLTPKYSFSPSGLYHMPIAN
jgi:dynein heavy chain